MTDFDFDCAQKKRIARGAFNRKGTANRKGCRLPHENLTKKELNKLNGECKTLKLKSKLTWDEFKDLSKEMQEEYLNYLIDHFEVGLTCIGMTLFGLGKTGLTNYCVNHNLNVVHRARSTNAAIEGFRRWVYEATIAPVKGDADAPATETTPLNEPNTPFRAHDYEGVRLFDEALRECGLEREVRNGGSVPNVERTFPTDAMSITLKGTPVEVLATLFSMFPTVLDEKKTYRFQISVDKYTIGMTTAGGVR